MLFDEDSSCGLKTLVANRHKLGFRRRVSVVRVFEQRRWRTIEFATGRSRGRLRFVRAIAVPTCEHPAAFAAYDADCQKRETRCVVADDTWCRTNDSISNRCDGRQRQTVQQWQGVCRLAGADAAQQIKWRIGTSRSHLEDGGSIYTSIVGPGHDVPHPIHQVGTRKV